MLKLAYIRIKLAAALVLPCLALFFLSGCARTSELKTLPQSVAEQVQHTVTAYYLDSGIGAIEALDPQAVSATSSGAAKYWYPQYLITAVIAVDRARTDVQISGWNDLLLIHESVGFNNAHVYGEMLLAAIAYGLEGNSFTLERAAYLWQSLQTENRLEPESFEAPVVVCYDYQAAALNKNGRNFEIIVPAEGTLSYEKGLLSNNPINSEYDMDAFMLSEGFRLLDGRCDETLYPGAASYENAARVNDYEHFNAAFREAAVIMRQDVAFTRMRNATDGTWYQFAVLCYSVIIIVWAASVTRRAMQKEIRRSALLFAKLLLGWIFTRLISFQLPVASDLSRYLWYGYYLFQLALPTLLLWLAWIIDRPDDSPKAAPVWFRAVVVINAALMALVMTNDLHNLVFRLDLRNPNWSSEYAYGPAVYIVMAGCFAPLAAGLAVMLYKARRNSRKMGFIFPLAFAAMLLIYAIAYITRIPVAWENDVSIVLGLFSCLFYEAAIQTGMIPVNIKYAALFTHSPLSMQITDSSGNAVLISDYARQADMAMYMHMTAPFPPTIQVDEDTLLFSGQIPGGFVRWKEDIAQLNSLRKKLETSIGQLQAANVILAEEEKVKRAADEENARRLLTAQLDNEIAAHTARLSEMLNRLENAADISAETVRIALLLCYIKRRCGLFFKEEESAALPPDELAAYINELAEIAGYSDIRVIAVNNLTEPLQIRRSTLFYDFFYSVLDWAFTLGRVNMLVSVGSENGMPVMRLLLPDLARSFAVAEELQAAIALAGGAIEAKDLDDSVGISLSFKEGDDNA